MPRPSFGGLRGASASGARATVREAGPWLRRLLGLFGRMLSYPAAWLLRLAGLAERGLRALLSALRGGGRDGLAIAERVATPERVLALVTGGAAACLIVSQFTPYRGVEVGQPQYSQVSGIAPPPQIDRVDAGAAHAYVLVPLAAIAVGVAIVSLLTRRWRLARLVSLVGLVGIAISLAIDIPKGLDAGTAGAAFVGAKATLTEGFYAQLSASAVLVLCGWVLASSLRPERRAPARRRRRPRRSRSGAQRAPSVAGGGA